MDCSDGPTFTFAGRIAVTDCARHPACGLEMEELHGYTAAMTSLRALAVLTLACALPVAATAQWQWIDQSGRKVFSDKAPPPEIPSKNILRQPGMKAGATAAAPAEAPASAPVAAARPAASGALKVSGKDKELEDKRKQAEAAEEEKKKAEAEAQAKVKAENCGRAKSAKATYDSGVRVARTNAKGEREFMDDKERAAETKRIEAVIASDCKPAS
jgi:type IV secretory pathway VirB10-like protein